VARKWVLRQWVLHDCRVMFTFSVLFGCHLLGYFVISHTSCSLHKSIPPPKWLMLSRVGCQTLLMHPDKWIQCTVAYNCTYMYCCTSLTVNHILMECPQFNHLHQQYHFGSTLKDLFNNTSVIEYRYNCFYQRYQFLYPHIIVVVSLLY